MTDKIVFKVCRVETDTRNNTIAVEIHARYKNLEEHIELCKMLSHADLITISEAEVDDV